MNSSNRSVMSDGSSSLRRDRGDTSVGYSVMKVGWTRFVLDSRLEHLHRSADGRGPSRSRYGPPFPPAMQAAVAVADFLVPEVCGFGQLGIERGAPSSSLMALERLPPKSIPGPGRTTVVPFRRCASAMLAQHGFGQVHGKSRVIGVGPVELQHREFGIVTRRHALVTEIAVDLVDPSRGHPRSGASGRASGAMRRYMSRFSAL